jgi:alpha-galactosidase
MWRLTDDLWDNWEQLYDMFGRCGKWSAFVGAGTWPDCDMLPLGHIGARTVADGSEARLTRFTKEEQRSLMTLWSIFRSPLLFGGDLRKLDDWTHSLLSEPYLIDAHQNGRDPKEVYRKEDLVIWVSESDTRKYVACFNLADRTSPLACCRQGMAAVHLVENCMRYGQTGQFRWPMHKRLLSLRTVSLCIFLSKDRSKRERIGKLP